MTFYSSHSHVSRARGEQEGSKDARWFWAWAFGLARCRGQVKDTAAKVHKPRNVMFIFIS